MKSQSFKYSDPLSLGGAAGTWFWIDPENDIVYISMIQRIGAGGPGSPLDTRHLSTTALYQALVNPEK